MSRDSQRRWDRVLKEAKVNKDSIIQLFVGKRIGRGASRHVYELMMDKTRVLKVEHTGYSFHNVAEWKVWQEVKDYTIGLWFAPCYDIDSLGNVLVQARTVPFESEEAFHAACGGKVPSCFDDIHYGNWGMFEGRVVCHDYGYNHLLGFAAKQDWQMVDLAARAEKGTHKPDIILPTDKPAEEPAPPRQRYISPQLRVMLNMPETNRVPS